MENNISLDNWDEFLSNWLKADTVKTTPAKFIVMKVRADKSPQGENQVVFTGNYEGKKFDFSLNKTNIDALKELKIISPKLCVNKILILTKIKQRNPNTGKMVDSLFIDKIE